MSFPSAEILDYVIIGIATANALLWKDVVIESMKYYNLNSPIWYVVAALLCSVVLAFIIKKLPVQYHPKYKYKSLYAHKSA